jgi:hypothetical protein
MPCARESGQTPLADNAVCGPRSAQEVQPVVVTRLSPRIIRFKLMFTNMILNFHCYIYFLITCSS